MSSRSIDDLNKEMHGMAIVHTQLCAAEAVELLIYCTLRSNKEQDELYDIGRTKPGKIVTNARTGQSAHNPDKYGLASAYDCCPMINGKPMWDSKHPSWQVVGRCGEEAGLVEIEQAMAEVERAKASLSLAHSKRLQVKVLRQDLETQKALIREARASLEVAIRQLEYSEVFAPVPGVVLVKSAEEGEYVSPGATVVTIADLDHPWLKGYVDETLGRVKLGQKVRIRTDTFPNKTYEGKVTFISSEAEFAPKQVQTQKERVKLVYPIKVDVDNPEGELKPGMPADGEILLGD